jgi:Tfp pilus assembly protein PilF
MDGRAASLFALTLAFACGGCVTSQKTTTTFAPEGQPPAVAKRDEPKKPAPPRLKSAFAELKEREADASKGTPERQAKLRDEARQIYVDTLKADPNSLEAARGLGRVYTQMDNFERAEEVYRTALAKHPKDMTLLYDFGTMHNRRHNWAEAKACFTKALEIDPENQKCLKALGFTLARAGQTVQSVAYLTRAMGSAASAHYNVALMLLHLSEQEPAAQRPHFEEQAKQHLRLALRENPSLSSANELLASLEQAAQNGVRQAAALQFSGE